MAAEATPSRCRIGRGWLSSEGARGPFAAITATGPRLGQCPCAKLSAAVMSSRGSSSRSSFTFQPRFSLIFSHE